MSKTLQDPLALLSGPSPPAAPGSCQQLPSLRDHLETNGKMFIYLCVNVLDKKNIIKARTYWRESGGSAPVWWCARW